MPRGRQRQKSGNMLMKSAEFIGWALGGLEREIAQTKERLSSLNAEAARLRAKLGNQKQSAAATAVPSADAVPARRRPRISVEGRRRIAEAQRRRWAEARKKKKKGASA